MLTSADVILQVKELPAGWSPTSLLDSITQESNPPFSALIDCGALVTGMSNVEVATYLVNRAKEGERSGERKDFRDLCKGSVYLDEDGGKKVVLAEAVLAKPISLSQCNLDVNQRFTFYDQVCALGDLVGGGCVHQFVHVA